MLFNHRLANGLVESLGKMTSLFNSTIWQQEGKLLTTDTPSQFTIL